MKPLTDKELNSTIDKKILEKGVTSLTEKEKEILFLSEQRYKKKLCRIYGNKKDELSEVLERQREYKEKMKKRINKG